MKKIYIAFSICITAALSSCSTHELDLGYRPIDTKNTAELRLLYDLPLASGTNEITRLTYNDAVYSEVSTSLGAGWPNSPSKYHSIPAGDVKISLYRGTTKDQLAYQQTVTFPAGRQTAFVYNAAQPPLVVFDEPYPTPDPWADTCAFVNFVNLAYKADGTTPQGPLTLKLRRGAGTAANPYVFTTLATVDFMATSGWIKVPLKPAKSGTETSLAYFTYDAGNVAFLSSTGISLAKGRFYYLHMNGKPGTTPNTTLRLSSFTAI